MLNLWPFAKKSWTTKAIGSPVFHGVTLAVQVLLLGVVVVEALKGVYNITPAGRRRQAENELAMNRKTIEVLKEGNRELIAALLPGRTRADSVG